MAQKIAPHNYFPFAESNGMRNKLRRAEIVISFTSST